MRYLKCLVLIAAALALAACGTNGDGTAAGSGVISLNGGAGGTAKGGNGGKFTTFSNSTSMVHGDLKFRRGGTVDVSFTVPTITPDLGTNAKTLTTGPTTVVFQNFSSAAEPPPADGTFYISNRDRNLHFSEAGKTDTTNVVTGLTVSAGATLQLPKNTVQDFTEIPGAVDISGTVTSAGEALDLRAGSFLRINSGGEVTTTPSAGDSGQITLVSGGGLINQGKVTSNGEAGGNSGGITLMADNFLYNTGTVSAKGDGAGSGGPIQLRSNTASVLTSGTIDGSGGNGVTGGNSGSIAISAGSAGIGRVVIGGTVTGNGGSGSAGNGGNGATISLTSFSGGILINATLSANGGEGKGTGSGGSGGSLQLDNRVGTDPSLANRVSPEGIRVAGNISLNGGTGDVQGGDAGAISVASAVTDNTLPGFASVEFSGYQAINLNGGNSTDNAGGNGGSVAGVLVAPGRIVNVDIPAGGVVNEVTISARGGDNSPGSAAKSAAGGTGGTIEFITPQTTGDATDPARTLVTSSGAIDVSGGTGTSGGVAGRVTMKGYGTLTSSGSITGRGGTGTAQGGAGAQVTLSSSGNVANSGGITVSGGDGNNGGNGGNGGSVSLSAGNQTTTAAIVASGGNSATANGGNGGKIDLFSEFATTSRSSLNVARGSGGSASNGAITIDGSTAAISAGGAI